MKQNIRIAKELIRLAKNLIEQEKTADFGFKKYLEKYKNKQEKDTEEQKQDKKEQQKKDKQYQIAWDSRGSERIIWLDLYGVDSSEQKQINKIVYDECKKNKLDGATYERGSFKMYSSGGDVKQSEYSDQPFKTIIDILQKNGFTKK